MKEMCPHSWTLRDLNLRPTLQSPKANPTITQHKGIKADIQAQREAVVQATW